MTPNVYYDQLKDLVKKAKHTISDTGLSPGNIRMDNEYVDQIRYEVNNRKELHDKNTEYNGDPETEFNSDVEILQAIKRWWDHYQSRYGTDWPMSVANSIAEYNRLHPNVAHSDFLRIKNAEGELANRVAYGFKPYDITTYADLIHTFEHYISSFRNGMDYSGHPLVEEEFVLFVNRVFPVMGLALKLISQGHTAA